MPVPKRTDTQGLERLSRGDLIARIVELERLVNELREAARRERAYADKMHDRAVRASNGKSALVISDADPL